MVKSINFLGLMTNILGKGFWSTCQPIGDLIGQQLENIIDDQSPFNWVIKALLSSVSLLRYRLTSFSPQAFLFWQARF